VKKGSYTSFEEQ